MEIPEEHELISFFSVLPTPACNEDEAEFFGTQTYDIAEGDLRLIVSFSAVSQDFSLRLYAGQKPDPTFVIHVTHVDCIALVPPYGPEPMRFMVTKESETEPAVVLTLRPIMIRMAR